MWGKLICCVTGGLIAANLSTGITKADAISTTEPATTMPVMVGRDTPAGAMNVYEQAIESGDILTVADSYNLPEAARVAFAQQLVAENEFQRAMKARFGEDATVNVCRECRVQVVARKIYVAGDWNSPPGQPDVAIGSAPDVQFMQKGPDGVWRLGRLAPRLMGRNAAGDRRVIQAAALAAKLNGITPGIKAGKYATPDDVIKAVYPEGSPMARMRAQEEEQKKADEAQQHQFLAQKFDLSSLGGAVSYYLQAIQKNDPAALAKCFFAKDDGDGKLARATAERILSAMHLMQVIGANVDENNGGSLVTSFGLLPDPMSVWDFTELQTHGDRAVSVYGHGEHSVWFQNIDGLWKQDITPEAPTTSAERTEDMSEDSAAIKRVATDVEAGKYKTLREVRDAMGDAMFNERPDPVFVQNDMWVEGEPQPGSKQIETVQGALVMNRNSPAGAMNTFVQALQKLDATTLADSLYIPEDKDGSGRRAAAAEYIAGMGFLRAVEARFNADDAQRICFAGGVVARYALRQYSDEEWNIPTDYPDLALSSHAAIRDQKSLNSGGPRNYIMGWAPTMHRCPDGNWRIGPRFAVNSRQAHIAAAAATAKAALLEKVAAATKAGKYATAEDLVNAFAATTTGP